MASDDFYTASAKQRYERICAERAACQADLAAHKANGDYDSAGETIQTLANLDAQAAHLENLYNRHVASQQPRQAPYVSPEERAARKPESMDWTDIVNMTRESKYAKNIRSDDPALVAGYHEAQRRRARGE